MESPCGLLVTAYTVTYIVSLTISKLLRYRVFMVKFVFRQGCTALVRTKPLNSRLQHLALKRKNINLYHGVKSISIFWTACVSQVWWREGRRDGRSDKWTSAI